MYTNLVLSMQEIGLVWYFKKFIFKIFQQFFEKQRKSGVREGRLHRTCRQTISKFMYGIFASLLITIGILYNSHNGA